MKSVIFLGTGAADFSPNLKTDLKDRLDKDARRSSSVLIDGRFLVDCGPHTLESMRILGIDPKCVSDLFITHFHADHYDPASVCALCDACGGKLRVFYREDATVALPDNCVKIGTRPGKTYDGDITFTSLAANHTAFPQHFLFESDGKKFFYGCDGAWMMNETYNRLKNAALDLIVLDGTVGDYVGDYRMAEHNSIPMIRLMLPSLRKIGAIGDGTLIYLSHIARTLHTRHDELCTILARDGMHAACDGLEIKL